MPLPRLPSLPRLDAQLLLAHVLEKPRAWVLAHPEVELDASQQARLQEALARLANGVPLPYVLGHWEFFGLDFTLTPDVLIPRPETELLVETALGWLKAHPRVSFAVDVGTGSGCIPISLAVHHPVLRLLAVDISLPALRLARHNALKHGVANRIHVVQSDILSPLPFREGGAGGTGLLLANLPYIPTQTLHGLDVYGHEPTLALDGGSEGLDLIHRLLAQAQTRLAPGGLALFEIEATQGAAVRALACQHFPTAQIQVQPDLAGLDRLLVIQKK